MEEMNLVKDLALILVTAGIFTIISKALKQPLILGYIIAGFLVGPHMGLFPNVTDTHSVEQWSEIGIIFLLFGLGLEFSFKKLLKVGSAALITAGLNCLGMFLIGILLGNTLGWSTMESIFLGGMLSMSSTTIIIKAFSEMGLTNKPFAPLVFGILVVEDLIAVLLMVLLSTLAVSSQFSGGEMLLAIGKLVFFLILWFLIGIYALPTLLKKFRSYLSDEILLLVSIGLCFGMVSLASYLGFSSALGAFVMGSILAETVEGERITHLTENIKNLFGAIFFVSVGMMLDPQNIKDYWGSILAITIVVLVGKFIFSILGTYLSGKGLSTGVSTSMSLLQLGEFSFIIAGLGRDLGVLRDFIYPVIISVSVVTTFTTPYIIKASGPMERFLRKRLPPKILQRMDHNDVDGKPSSTAAKSAWKKMLKEYFLRILMYSVVLIAIILASDLFLADFLNSLFSSWNEMVLKALLTTITLAVMMPFLYGLAIAGKSIKKSAAKLVSDNPANSWPVLALVTLRILIAMAFVVVVLTNNFKMSGWGVLITLLILFGVFAFFRINFHRFTSIEDRFFENLNAKENQARKQNPVSSSVRENLAIYDIHPESFTLQAESVYAGMHLADIPIRMESGANIVKIQRGKKSILIPDGKERIFPGDELVAVGTREQLGKFVQLMNTVALNEEDTKANFSLSSFVLDENSYLTGKSLREANLRAANCMVICVLRDKEMITNPSPDWTFTSGDAIWLAGEAESVNWFTGTK